jgi:hypothetical protein
LFYAAGSARSDILRVSGPNEQLFIGEATFQLRVLQGG